MKEENDLFRRAMMEPRRILEPILGKSFGTYVSPLEEKIFIDNMMAEDKLKVCRYYAYKLFHFIKLLHGVSLLVFVVEFIENERKELVIWDLQIVSIFKDPKQKLSEEVNPFLPKREDYEKYNAEHNTSIQYPDDKVIEEVPPKKDYMKYPRTYFSGISVEFSKRKKKRLNPGMVSVIEGGGQGTVKPEHISSLSMMTEGVTGADSKYGSQGQLGENEEVFIVNRSATSPDESMTLRPDSCSNIYAMQSSSLPSAKFSRGGISAIRPESNVSNDCGDRDNSIDWQNSSTVAQRKYSQARSREQDSKIAHSIDSLPRLNKQASAERLKSLMSQGRLNAIRGQSSDSRYTHALVPLPAYGINRPPPSGVFSRKKRAFGLPSLLSLNKSALDGLAEHHPDSKLLVDQAEAISSRVKAEEDQKKHKLIEIARIKPSTHSGVASVEKKVLKGDQSYLAYLPPRFAKVAKKMKENHLDPTIWKWQPQQPEISAMNAFFTAKRSVQENRLTKARRNVGKSLQHLDRSTNDPSKHKANSLASLVGEHRAKSLSASSLRVKSYLR